MTADLATTNTLLGVMALVSVIEALALIGAIVGGFLLYRRINAILDDVKRVTSLAKGAAETADVGMRSSLAWLLRRVRSAGRAA